MKLIDSKVELIEEKDLYKMIEIAGRTCYKSEDKITEDSAKAFVDRMIKSGHEAVLEHGTVYLTIEKVFENLYPEARLYWWKQNDKKFSKVSMDTLGTVYVTTNLRVLIENDRLDDLEFLTEPTEHHEKRITVRFTCDRGVSHEFVRHRVFSFAQESTRYCNYSKDKFGNELTFIKPSWWDKDGLNGNIKADFEDHLIDSEERYLNALALGLKPQEARQLLPNALKTELVMTGFESDWEGFFKLRCSPAAHPDAKKLADELRSLIVK